MTDEKIKEKLTELAEEAERLGIIRASQNFSDQDRARKRENIPKHISIVETLTAELALEFERLWKQRELASNIARKIYYADTSKHICNCKDNGIDYCEACFVKEGIVLLEKAGY